MHDPRVGRFFAVDPLFKVYAYNSPYAFAENKVIKFNELEGLEISPSKKERETMGYGQKVALGTIDGTIIVAKDMLTLIKDPAGSIYQSADTGFNLGRDAYSIVLSWVFAPNNQKKRDVIRSGFDESLDANSAQTGKSLEDGAVNLYNTIVHGDAYDRTKIGTEIAWGLLSERVYSSIVSIKVSKLPVNNAKLVKTPFFGSDVRPATILRELTEDDKIADIVKEAIRNTMMDDVEHAVIKLTDGRRVLVSGGKNGIELPSNTALIYGHTHPRLPRGANNTPSPADREVLDFLKQSKQYIFHDGQRTTIFRGKDSTFDLENPTYKNIDGEQ